MSDVSKWHLMDDVRDRTSAVFNRRGKIVVLTHPCRVGEFTRGKCTRRFEKIERVLMGVRECIRDVRLYSVVGDNFEIGGARHVLVCCTWKVRAKNC